MLSSDEGIASRMSALCMEGRSWFEEWSGLAMDGVVRR